MQPTSCVHGSGGAPVIAWRPAWNCVRSKTKWRRKRCWRQLRAGQDVCAREPNNSAHLRHESRSSMPLSRNLPSEDSKAHAFAQIRTEWDISAPEGSDLSPLIRLRREYATVFRYTVAFPEFHRFMRQETLTNNPRLKWVAETVIAP